MQPPRPCATPHVLAITQLGQSSLQLRTPYWRRQGIKLVRARLGARRYNARAYVNKGCVLVERGDLEGARSLFNEAAGIDPYCVEAIFNLGVVSQRLNELPYALAAFKKLHNMVPDNVEVSFTGLVVVLLYIV